MIDMLDTILATAQASDEMTQAQLARYLLLSVLLMGVGLCGFMARRNLIVMFLCTELMFQAAVIAFVAFGRWYWDFSGQVFVIFILTIAAAEAALALALVVLLHRRRDSLDASLWTELHE